MVGYKCLFIEEQILVNFRLRDAVAVADTDTYEDEEKSKSYRLSPLKNVVICLTRNIYP